MCSRKRNSKNKVLRQGQALTCSRNRNKTSMVGHKVGGKEIDEKEGHAGVGGHSRDFGFYSTCDGMVSSFPSHLK